VSGDRDRNSAELLDAARRLHRDHIVVDTEAPVFTSQLVLSERMIERAHEMLAEGRSRSAIKMALGETLAEDLERSPDARSEYLGHWRRAGVTVASSSVYDVGEPWHAWEETQRELEIGARVLKALEGALVEFRTAADMSAAHAAGKAGVIQNLQNTDPLEDRIDRIDSLYDRGVRICQLTYNLRTRFGDGCLERRDGGLSRLGVALVERLNHLGILVDLSHCSDQTTLDAAEVSSKPVAVTHSSSRAISGHARGKPDEVLAAVANKGGFVGVLLVPFFIVPPSAPGATNSGNATLDDVVRHVRHFINVAGEDAVGIGTDWSKPFQDALNWGPTSLAARSQTSGYDWVGWRPQDRYSRTVWTEGFERFDQWPNITAALLGAGLSERVVAKVIGQNFVRVFGEVCG
jgi:membrane dipeptidase